MYQGFLICPSPIPPLTFHNGKGVYTLPLWKVRGGGGERRKGAGSTTTTTTQIPSGPGWNERSWRCSDVAMKRLSDVAWRRKNNVYSVNSFFFFSTHLSEAVLRSWHRVACHGLASFAGPLRSNSIRTPDGMMVGSTGWGIAYL